MTVQGELSGPIEGMPPDPISASTVQAWARPGPANGSGRFRSEFLEGNGRARKRRQPWSLVDQRRSVARIVHAGSDR